MVCRDSERAIVTYVVALLEAGSSVHQAFEAGSDPSIFAPSPHVFGSFLNSVHKAEMSKKS